MNSARIKASSCIATNRASPTLEEARRDPRLPRRATVSHAHVGSDPVHQESALSKVRPTRDYKLGHAMFGYFCGQIETLDRKAGPSRSRGLPMTLPTGLESACASKKRHSAVEILW